MPANLENSAVSTGLEKVSFIPILKKINAKNGSNYHTIALILQASKVMLKIVQVRLQQYVNCERPDVQAVLKKGRRTRDQTANIYWIIDKAREFHKSIYVCFIDYTKAFDCVDHKKLENTSRMGIPASWEICMQIKKQQLEQDMEQQTDSKLGKENVKAL